MVFVTTDLVLGLYNVRLYYLDVFGFKPGNILHLFLYEGK